jgi:required for meiotic nuclear division protein 1
MRSALGAHLARLASQSSPFVVSSRQSHLQFLPAYQQHRQLQSTSTSLRSYTSKASSYDQDTPPKPKSSTPLRRAAAASLPIRKNPTPTRSSIQPIFTLSTAERYVLSRLRDRLPPDAQLLHESWWVPRWRARPEGQEGEIFIFSNGSFVCWGLGEDEAGVFAREVLGRANIEIGRMKEAETEDLEFVTDPSE